MMSLPKIKSKKLKYFASVVVLNYARVAAGFLSLILVARFLSVRDQGLYSLARSMTDTLSKFFHFSLAVSVVYFYGKVDRKNLLNSMFWLSILLGVSGGVVDAIALRNIYHLPHAIAFVAALQLFLIIVYYINSAYLQAIGRVDKFALLNTSGTFVKLLLIVALMGVFSLKTPLAALSSGTTAMFLMSVVSVWIIRKWLTVKIKLDWKLLKSMVSYTLWLHLHNILWFMVLKSDILIIGYLLDKKAVGYYSIASLIGDGIKIFTNSINQALLPILVRTRSLKTVFKYGAPSMLILIIGGVIFTLIAKPFTIITFGSKYIPSIPSIVVIVWATMVLSTNSFLAHYFIAVGKPWVNTISSATGFTANIVLDFILIPRMGILGAAVASFISYTIMLIVTLSMLIFGGRRLHFTDDRDRHADH